MAKIKYGCYLFDEDNCYVISNADMEYAEDVCDKSFTNPPIKMTVEALETEWELAFDAQENYMNHSILQDNLMAVLRGELSEFRLTGVNVGEESIYLIYSSTLPPEKLWDDMEGTSGGQVFVRGEFTMLFETTFINGSPTKQYRVESRRLDDIHYRIQVTEYIEERKHRKLEFCNDALDIPYLPGYQYCIITEY